MPPQPGTLRNRWTAYAALSTALAAGVVLKSLAQRPNFYSAAVYLSQSSANLMILCNLVFVTACSVLLALQQTLYGPLRPIEIEQLYEKAWFAVTETCLAMTIFRGEIGAWFLVMFFSLLAGKVWGWIGEGRVEVLEQQQQNTNRLVHTRLILSLALSVVFDACMLDYTVGQVLHMARPDMMVMFGFEFAVLTISSVSTALRYTLNLVEGSIVRKQKQKRVEIIRKERIETARGQVQTSPDPATEDEAMLARRRADAEALAAAAPIDDADIEVEGWEGKGRWTFYLDLTTDFCKLVIYLSFFFILLIFYGLPLHIMRDVFLTCRSFFKRIGDFVRYRNATRDMNERYPDATEAEIQREDVCIICREDMRVYTPPAQGVPVDPVAERMRPKKLPCGHVLHFSCLRSWLERQQICPTCRANVAPTAQAQTQSTNVQPQQGAQQPQQRGNRGPRVYQLGPLRIGVGAVRGNDLFEQLDQHLGNQNGQHPVPGNGAGAQQYGFGIRWGAARRRNEGNSRHRRSIEEQLSSLERQLQREADALQTSLGELQALRNVQAQLNRIRMSRDAGIDQSQAQAAPNQQRPVAMQQVATPFRVAQQQNVLQAGNDQLPAGLTLPEGWSMIPLEPARGPVQPLPPLPNGIPVPMMRGPLQTNMPMNVMQPPNLPPNMPYVPNVPNMQPPAMMPPMNLPFPNLPGQIPPEQLAQMGINAGINAAQQVVATHGTHATRIDVDVNVHSSLPPMSQPPATDSLLSGNSSTLFASRSASPSAGPTSVSDPPQRQEESPPPSQPRAQTQPRGATRVTPATHAPVLTPTTRPGRRIPPHRSARSIGSTWGFGETDDEDDDEEEEDERKTAQTEGKAAAENDDESDEDDSEEEEEIGKAKRRQPVRDKGKSATAEDTEDPD